MNEVIIPHISTGITWFYLIAIGYCLYRWSTK